MAKVGRPKPVARKPGSKEVAGSRATSATTTKPSSTQYPQHKPAQFPLNKIKARIRDLERLLKNAKKLPDEKQVQYERELTTCRSDLAHNIAQNHKTEMAKRYHMVRFFDRQKANRVLKQARKRLASAQSADSTTQKELQKAVEEAEIDFNYALFSPIAIPYNALYPKSSVDREDTADTTDTGSKQPSRGNPQVRDLVRQAIKNNTLTELRETLNPADLGLDPGKSKYTRNQPATDSKPQSDRTAQPAADASNISADRAARMNIDTPGTSFFG